MSILCPLAQVLVLFAVASLLSGITRVTRARLHNHRGSDALQEYHDIIRLPGRQSVVSVSSSQVFRLASFVVVGMMLIVATALSIVTTGSSLPQLGDLITLVYLFVITRFFFPIAGLDIGSPFTTAGASHEMMLGVLVEPTLLLRLWVATQVASLTHISNIADATYHWPATCNIPLILALYICISATFIEVGKLPLNPVEARQGLQEDSLAGYSGSGFAVLK